MDFLFTRRFYVAFGATGMGLDYIGHYVAAVQQRTPDPILATFKILSGWNDGFFANGQPLQFGLSIAAHSMFIVAYILLAVRAR